MNRRLSPTLLATLAGLLLGACGDAETDKYGGNTAPAPGQGAAAPRTVDPATAGAIAGRITFQGVPPEMPAIVFSSQDKCATMHTEPVYEERVLVDGDGGLANCFVFLEGPSGYAAPAEAVSLDQLGCRYDPHVLGIQVGQTLRIRNSDGFLHNVHYIPMINEEQNLAFPEVMSMDRTFTDPEQMIAFQCEVHPWMKAYVGVVDHPFHAVTAADGSFTIEGVPPGDHTLVVWHEEFGRRELTVTVATGGTAQVQESFSAGS